LNGFWKPLANAFQPKNEADGHNLPVSAQKFWNKPVAKPLKQKILSLMLQVLQIFHSSATS
jgi:hypothetical protein